MRKLQSFAEQLDSSEFIEFLATDFTALKLAFKVNHDDDHDNKQRRSFDEQSNEIITPFAQQELDEDNEELGGS